MYLVDKENYSLRPITEDDLPMVLAWRNSERIRAVMYTDHHITQEEHHRWYAKIKDDTQCCYLIFNIKDIPYGLVNFTSINTTHNRCMFGYYLGRVGYPKGSGAIMEFLTLDYAFLKIKIRKLCCEVLSFNLPSLNLNKKFGFHEEGCLKKHIIKNNEYHDVLQLALFAEEWLEQRLLMEKKLFKDAK